MNPAGRLPRARGLTLVELMVTMALGLFLVGVMGTIFLGSKGTFQSQNQVARLQESARFSVDTISADLRMAGFQGCRGLAGALVQVANDDDGALLGKAQRRGATNARRAAGHQHNLILHSHDGTP